MYSVLTEIILNVSCMNYCMTKLKIPNEITGVEGFF